MCIYQFHTRNYPKQNLILSTSTVSLTKYLAPGHDPELKRAPRLNDFLQTILSLKWLFLSRLIKRVTKMRLSKEGWEKLNV
jgi:hypothetical protein